MIDHDIELQSMVKRKVRRDQADHLVVDDEETNNKRRRIRDKLQDVNGHYHETGNDYCLPRMASGPGDNQGKLIQDSDTARVFKKYTNQCSPGTDQATRVAAIISQNRAPHLTRSRVASATATPKHVGPTTIADEHWEPIRYSKVNDLGPRWKKPLWYPQIGRKKTTVEWKDLERLDDGEFLNDNLIGFYLRYLETRLEEEDPALAKRVYWFNTFFFASLTQTARGKGRINYDAVKKWTRNVDIFNFDYVVVPINESAHWYIAIICNLPALDRGLATTGHEPQMSPSPPHFETLDDSNEIETEEAPRTPPLSATHRTEIPCNEAEKPEEEHTRESLAELHIHDGSTVSNKEKIRAHSLHDADEILDSDDDMDVRTSKGDMKNEVVDDPSPDSAVELDDVVVKAVSESKLGSQKKGKRKSNPPIKTLDPEQPAIITLDSLGIAHSPTIRALKDYLHAEGADKRGGMVFDDSNIKGCTAKQIPQQDNFCDCGLFLLGYMERFLKTPKEFVTKILQREFDGQRDWAKMEPSAMRTNIRELVLGLHAEQEGQTVPKKELSTTVSDQRKGGEQHSRTVQVTKSKPSATEAATESTSIRSRTNSTEEVQDAVPKTRQQALDSASQIDALDSALHVQALNRADESTSRNLVRQASPINMDELGEMIIPDSQEGKMPELPPAHPASDTEHPATSDGIEVRIEKRASTPRPPTQGKPHAQEGRTARSPRKAKERKVPSRPRENQDVIAIDG